MKKYLLLFCLLPCARVLSAQPAWIKDSLDLAVHQAMQAEQVPGLALAVVQDGKVALLRTYGLREAGKKATVDENTLFMIGSNSKAYTATALALLENEGTLSLDDKVRQWMPGFRLFNDCSSSEVTLRDLLCHRLGTRTFQGDFTFWTSTLTRKEVIEKMALLEPPFAFRTRFGYCNAAFLTAGELIPLATGGQPWENFVREHFFKPLQMNHALALASEMPAATNAAKPHAFYDNTRSVLPFPAIDNLAPAGSISLSISDMTHWILMQLDTGRYAGKQVFPKQVILKTWMANTLVNPNTLSAYGLGWFIYYRQGNKVIGHTGGVDGFATASCFLPEERLGVIVLTNTDNNALFTSLQEQLIDVYTGVKGPNHIAEATAAWLNGQKEEAERIAGLRAKVAEKRPAPQALQAYTGVFNNNIYGDVEVRLEKNKLKVYLSHHPHSTGTLEHMGDNAFLCTFADPTMGIHPLTFTIENNRVDGLTLKVNDFVEYGAYIFRRIP